EVRVTNHVERPLTHYHAGSRAVQKRNALSPTLIAVVHVEGGVAVGRSIDREVFQSVQFGDSRPPSARSLTRSDVRKVHAGRDCDSVGTATKRGQPCDRGNLHLAVCLAADRPTDASARAVIVATGRGRLVTNVDA